MSEIEKVARASIAKAERWDGAWVAVEAEAILAKAVLDQQAEIEHLRELVSCAVYTKLNSAYQAKEVEIERERATAERTREERNDLWGELAGCRQTVRDLKSELRIEKASQATRGNA